MLTEERRQQLDGIVQKMVNNKEAESDIQFVVNDFKSKYDAAPAKPDTGYMARLGGDFDRRINKSAEISRNKDMTSLEKRLGYAGQGLGMVSDVGNEAMGSLLRLIPDSAKKAISGTPIFPPAGNLTYGDAAKALGDLLGYGKEKYGEFEKQNPRSANILNTAGNAVNAAGVLSAIKPAAAIGKEALDVGVDVAKLAGQTAKVGAGKIIPKNAPQSLIESGAKWSTTLAPEVRKNLTRTMLDEKINLSPKGYDKLNSSIDDINKQIKTALEPHKDVAIDAESVIKRTDEARNKASKSYDPASEIAKVDEETTRFLENWGGKLTVADAQAIKQDIYKQLKSHYDSVAKGGPGKYTDGEIAAKKNIARGLKEEIENAVSDAPIKELNARETKLLKLEPHLRRAVNRVENHNILSLDDVLSAGVGTTVGGFAGGPVGAAIGAAAGGAVKRALGHPGTKSRLAMALDSLKNAEVGIDPKSATLKSILSPLNGLDGITSAEYLAALRPASIPAFLQPELAVGPVRSGIPKGEPYGPPMSAWQPKPKMLPEGQGFELQGGAYDPDVIDVPFTSKIRTIPGLPGTESRLSLPPGETIPGNDFVMYNKPRPIAEELKDKLDTIKKKEVEPIGTYLRQVRERQRVKTEKTPENMITRIVQLGGIKHSPDFNTKWLKEDIDGKRVLNNTTGHSPDAMANILKGEGYSVRSTDEMMELIKSGKGRTMYNPELRDKLIARDIRRKENEWVERKLADLEATGEYKSGSIGERIPDHQTRIIDEIRSEGLIEEASEDAALKEISDFFSEMSGRSKNYPASNSPERKPSTPEDRRGK